MNATKKVNGEQAKCAKPDNQTSLVKGHKLTTSISMVTVHKAHSPVYMLSPGQSLFVTFQNVCHITFPISVIYTSV